MSYNLTIVLQPSLFSPSFLLAVPSDNLLALSALSSSTCVDSVGASPQDGP